MLLLTLGAVVAQEWTPLFNGRDLDGWEGDPRLWSVNDGVVTGVTDNKDRSVSANSFLVWKGGEPGDFELEYEARVAGDNNSGVQYRSRRPGEPAHALAGYQIDLHPNQPYLAMLYDERGRGILAERGMRIEQTAEGRRELGKLPVPEVNASEWNHYRVWAKGPVLRHYVNGELALEFIDLDEEKRSLKGLIGLQLHAGPPMKVEFKGIRLREMGADEAQAPEDETGNFQVAPGFKLERVYQVPEEQGSWVAMTMDGAGRLICSDQYGKLYRVLPAAAGVEGAVTVVEPLPIPIGGAHGLLWHRGVLYVSVNEAEGGQSGVWMVEQQGNSWGEPRLIKKMEGRGEHGPHALVPSPDGEWIYFVAGNFTDLPEMDDSFPSRSWGEDQLLPRNPDGRGHARDRMAPGGWIARFLPDGSQWELVAMGFRNPYDIAFGPGGSLFAYDADMEWDFGMPWYRPTRICHVVPGAEFGWRNGTGKWPAYYEDSMSAAHDIGPGSPTGLLFGAGLAFPEKYQRALYALDWTFATIHVLHLTGDGATFGAEREELVAGAGLPLTDAVVGPEGAMYFTTGGRRTGSALWRVTYVGDEPTGPVAADQQANSQLEEMEGLVRAPDEKALAKVWEALGSEDRVVRFAARAALERLPVSAWRNRMMNERDPWRTILGAMALVRTGGADTRATALKALHRLEWDALSKQQKLNWLRAAGLVFIRSGGPDAGERGKVLSAIDAAYPADDYELNAELCRMLCYLEAPDVVSRTLTLMERYKEPALPDWAELISRNDSYGGDIRKMMANHPPTAQIHFVYCLRVVKGPWREDERRAVFEWFREVVTREGGRSFRGFIEQMRKDMLANATEEERVRFAAEAAAPEEPVLANLPAVEGPGQVWTVDEVVALAESGLEGRDIQRGSRMFQASLCAACHRFGGEGGASGPDLTSVVGRFTVRDLAEAIIEPGKVVSDQYAFELFKKHDGTSLVGKTLNEQDEVVSIAINPFDLSQTTELPRSEIAEIVPSPVSPMPPGLINRLNAEELKDLLAYLLAKE